MNKQGWVVYNMNMTSYGFTPMQIGDVSMEVRLMTGDQFRINLRDGNREAKELPTVEL